MRKNTIVIIEDDAEMLAVLEEYLKAQDYKVLGFSNPEDALHFLRKHNHHTQIRAIVSDICMPDKSGIDVLIESQQINKKIPVIMISAFSAPCYEQDALSNGAYAFISKPFPLSKISSAVTQAIA